MCLASLSVLHCEAFRLDLDLTLVFVQFDLNKMDMLSPGVLCLHPFSVEEMWTILLLLLFQIFSQKSGEDNERQDMLVWLYLTKERVTSAPGQGPIIPSLI